MSITKLSPNWAYQMGPIHFIKFLLSGQCFQFGVKELWRDGKGRGLNELVGWVRHLSQCWREFVPERRGSYGYGGVWKIEGGGERKGEEGLSGWGIGWK